MNINEHIYADTFVVSKISDLGLKPIIGQKKRKNLNRVKFADQRHERIFNSSGVVGETHVPAL